MLGELFDPKAELLINERLRPHWSQAGAIVFVTFHTIDSIPKEVLTRWEREKQDWVARQLLANERERSQSRGSLREPTDVRTPDHGAISDPPPTSDRGAISDNRHWSKVLPRLDKRQQNQFYRHFNRCREMKLDECLGRCLLRQSELGQIVAKSLLHFDGERYRMGDFVVMPNHVHLLAAFATAEAMEEQFDSWLHYTAFRIHQQIGESGHFWQQEPFDHLVRSVEQYDYLRKYIADNPMKAGLREGEYICRRYSP